MKTLFNATCRSDFIFQAYHTVVSKAQDPKSIWTKPDGMEVWMVRMNGQVHNSWKNTRYEDKIVEEYVGSNPPSACLSPIRVAVCITDRQNGGASEYEILGTYKLCISESKINTYRVWYKISDKM